MAPSVIVFVVDQFTVRDHVSDLEEAVDRDQFRLWPPPPRECESETVPVAPHCLASPSEVASLSCRLS